nr:MAG TPA: Replication associated protein [Microviridae sp.]
MKKVFLPCLHPYIINTARGNINVACGKCIPCQNAKRSRLNLLLDLEAEGSKYCEFITLTYSDEFCPWIDFTDAMYGCTFEYYNTMRFPLHFGDRYVNRYLKGKYIKVRDNTYREFYTLPLGGALSGDLQEMLSVYNDRYLQYQNRFPDRNFSAPCHRKFAVRFLYFPDVQKYIKRLNKLFHAKYSSSFRYFVVGEYGTNGLRPHWHILLFHNSDNFRRDMRNVIQLHGHTSTKKREISKTLLPLWSFGDSTSVVTDGKITSYVASYVNQSSQFPSLLEQLFPQKSSHSVLLGETRSKEELSSLLKKGEFDELCTNYVTSSKGVRRSVSVPSATYDRFCIRFTGFSGKNIVSAYPLLSATKYFLDKTDINIYDDSEVYDVQQWLFNKYTNHLSMDKNELLIARYIHDFARFALVHNNSVNPLKSLFYASKKLYKISHYLGLHPYTYLKVSVALLNYIEYTRFVDFLSFLEINPITCYQYYSSFNKYLGVLDFDIYYNTPLFRSYVAEANNTWYSNIKHREITELYK